MTPRVAHRGAAAAAGPEHAVPRVRVDEALHSPERELVGLTPVKARVREIAAPLPVEKLRRGVAP